MRNGKQQTKSSTGDNVSGSTTGSRRAVAPSSSSWNLRLYVAGNSLKSQTALTNLKRLCEQHLAGQYSIEVVDLKERPDLAKADQIFALPTLVRKIPEPVKRIIGDLSNTDRALIALDIGGRGL